MSSKKHSAASAVATDASTAHSASSKSLSGSAASARLGAAAVDIPAKKNLATHLLGPSDWPAAGVELKKHDKTVINKAKEKARADLELNEWAKSGWAFDRGACVAEPAPMGFLAREHASKLSFKDFVEKYEKANLPVMIDGFADSWPAFQGAWHPKELYSKYRHRRFRCGEDDDGYPVKMKLKYFMRYLAGGGGGGVAAAAGGGGAAGAAAAAGSSPRPSTGTRDDSPLYIFDSMYEDASKTRSCGILHDYTVPLFFSREKGQDIFSLVGEHRRPPYRWFLMGPARSGTRVHIDPLGTSAWNTLIYGRKRWVLFPPEVGAEISKGKALQQRGEDDEAVDYFNLILPRIKASQGGEAWVKAGKVIECVQYPGETIFVPSGWWHAVLNLDDTIAITQNYCSPGNFERVWVQARKGRRGMARKLLGLLRTHYPALAAQADRLNAEVGWDAAAEAARHRKRKAEKAAKREAKLKAKAEKEARKKARKEEERKKRKQVVVAAGMLVEEDSSDEDTSSDSSSSSSSSSCSSSSGSVTSDSSLSSGARALRAKQRVDLFAAFAAAGAPASSAAGSSSHSAAGAAVGAKHTSATVGGAGTGAASTTQGKKHKKQRRDPESSSGED